MKSAMQEDEMRRVARQLERLRLGFPGECTIVEFKGVKGKGVVSMKVIGHGKTSEEAISSLPQKQQ